MHLDHYQDSRISSEIIHEMEVYNMYTTKICYGFDIVPIPIVIIGVELCIHEYFELIGHRLEGHIAHIASPQTQLFPSLFIIIHVSNSWRWG